ncbi:hypothetical protein [Streptomyces mirabilis]|uniref:hypothetical protein n=1 Tax=Streptomyces mirabilis TaxID=68239 RepID=UPI0036DF58DE
MAQGSVHASPAGVGVNFKIESVLLSGGISRLEVLATGGHKLAGAGMRAVLATLNTYYGTTLTAAQVDAIVANAGHLLTRLNAYRVSCNVQAVDLTANANLVGQLATNLQAAGSVVVG